jgi:hypothetical protein
VKFENFEEIANLWEFRTRESQVLEFKSEIPRDNKKIAREISGFANTSGGYLIYGIKENESVAIDSEGISLDKQEERINSVIETTVRPSLRANIVVVNSKDEEGELIPNKGFIVIYTQISPLRPHMVTTNGKFYFRQSTSTFSYEAIATNDENRVCSAYRERMGEQQRQKSYFEEVENRLKRYSDGQPYLLLGFVPQVLSDNIIHANEEIIRELLLERIGTQNHVKYGSNINVYAGSPMTVKGGCIMRSGDGQLMMINDNLSLFFMLKLPSNHNDIPPPERKVVRLEKLPLDIIKNLLEVYGKLLENNEFNSSFVYHIQFRLINGLALMERGRSFSEDDLKEEFYLGIVDNLEEEHNRILSRLERSLNLSALLYYYKEPSGVLK